MMHKAIKKVAKIASPWFYKNDPPARFEASRCHFEKIARLIEVMQHIDTNKNIDATSFKWQLSGVNQTVNRRPSLNVGANQIWKYCF